MEASVLNHSTIAGQAKIIWCLQLAEKMSKSACRAELNSLMSNGRTTFRRKAVSDLPRHAAGWSHGEIKNAHQFDGHFGNNPR
jgi:hypothetical protein